MGKKTVIAILIVLIAALALVVGYYVSESPNDENREILTVSTGSIPLIDIIEDVETGSYYEGYDNETLKWMKSLGDKSVFSGDGTFVVMSPYDASKLHSEFVTDVYITQDFRCTVLETHSLGNVTYPKDVILVEDVEYLRENITYFDV